MNKLFIGIDFSKKKVDVSVIEKENMSSGVHREFSNDVAGHESLWHGFVKAIRRQARIRCSFAVRTRDFTAFV